MKISEKIKVKPTIAYIISALVIAGFEILGEILDALQNARELGIPAFSTMSLLGLAIKGVLIFVLIAIVLERLYWLGKKLFNDKATVTTFFEKKRLVMPVMLVSWIPCFLAYFPGIYSYDGEPQLIQYTTGQFDNHHPVFHTLIMGWCYDLGQWFKQIGIPIDGIAFYSVTQMLILAYALSSVVVYLAKKKVGKWYLMGTMVLFGIFPVTPVMAISTTKDTFFTAFFVLMMVKILELVNGKENWKQQATIGICAVFCMLFRRNASYVFILMIIIFAIIVAINAIKAKKINFGLYERCFVVFAVAILTFNISEKAIMSATDAVQGESAEALSVPLMQIARAYKSNQDPVTDKYGEVLFEYIPQLGLNNYRPLISDGVKQQFNNELFAKDKMSFIKLYFQMFKDYPVDYAQAFLYMTKGDWQLMDNSHCEVYKNWWRDRTGYLITDATPIFALDYVEKANLAPGIRNVYEAIVTDSCYRNFFLLQIIFAPAFYVYLVVLSGLALLLKKQKTRIVVWLFVGIYLLTIIAGPCVLVRYIFPLMMLAPILGVLVFAKEG